MVTTFRLAVYPGTFDPPTLGHLDVIERATKLFDRIIIAVGTNSGKRPLLSVKERIAAIEACVQDLPNVEVSKFDGLLVDFVKEVKASSIIRGLRATADFEYEFQMAMVNRRLSENVESVFLMTKWDYSYLSSSIVREVAQLGGDYSEMVAPAVIPIMQKALARKNGG